MNETPFISKRACNNCKEEVTFTGSDLWYDRKKPNFGIALTCHKCGALNDPASHYEEGLFTFLSSIPPECWHDAIPQYSDTTDAALMRLGDACAKLNVELKPVAEKINKAVKAINDSMLTVEELAKRLRSKNSG